MVPSAARTTVPPGKAFEVKRELLASIVVSFLSERGVGRRIRALFERAKQLVLDTNYTLEQLAREGGFATASYLISLFRKHVGMTPNAYRESFRQVNWER